MDGIKFLTVHLCSVSGIVFDEDVDVIEEDRAAENRELGSSADSSSDRDVCD